MCSCLWLRFVQILSSCNCQMYLVCIFNKSILKRCQRICIKFLFETVQQQAPVTRRVRLWHNRNIHVLIKYGENILETFIRCVTIHYILCMTVYSDDNSLPTDVTAWYLFMIKAFMLLITDIHINFQWWPVFGKVPSPLSNNL